ncbi:DUF3768 domain-containing protein [Candidatus Saccharibacteria bacterium]|nr:DUF3768 domain-containing protein [Candidatus Saccharibacteria bacterium]
MDTEVNIATEIAKKNDEFRKFYSYVITKGIEAIPDVMDVLDNVRSFKDFTDDNDPYAEHDFGSFECQSKTIFWKIDYYDQNLQNWCDPLSTSCNRVLTVMLSEEY